jgi:transcriptional regulator GlxA family with amidase domain
MKRREVIKKAVAFGAVPALSSAALSAAGMALRRGDQAVGTDPKGTPTSIPLRPPAKGSIPVAFVVSEGVVVIDLCGPWAVFQAVSLPGRTEQVFHLYTVGETTAPISGAGGLRIIPDYPFGAAPAPKIIVIPEQSSRSQATLEWVRKSAPAADLTMSICTGAFLLASTGLLSGRAATTHHDGYKGLAMEFPDIRVERGARFVDDGNLATSGGLFAGIDLALHVVERYYGREVAEKTAYQLEYQGLGWTNSRSNEVYAKARKGSDQHPLCPVCEMEVDPSTAPKSTFRGKTYYFCMPAHKEVFDGAPDKWI